MTTAWAKARLQSVTDSRETAAATLWQVAEQDQEDGYTLTAAVNALISLTIFSNELRIEKLRDWLDEAQAPLLTAWLEHVQATSTQDINTVIDNASDLASAGLTHLAMKAYDTAIQLAHRLDEPRSAQLADARRTQLLATLRPGGFEAPPPPADKRLTARERDVVELAKNGLSNREIADLLSLSIRTVENHIHRAMRKTGASNRRLIEDQRRSP
jgi:DNA-binding NarL/FixJ family response regulator